jgi:hypothetical protein
MERRLIKKITRIIQNNNLMLTIGDVQFTEVSREFIQKRIKKMKSIWICPLCERPHLKKPGPFKCGISINNNMNNFAIWVQSSDCCGWEQSFLLNEVKGGKVNFSSLNSVFGKVFNNR